MRDKILIKKMLEAFCTNSKLCDNNVYGGLNVYLAIWGDFAPGKESEPDVRLSQKTNRDRWQASTQQRKQNNEP